MLKHIKSLQFLPILSLTFMIGEEAHADVSIGTVYSFEYINEFKKRLQIKQGEDMIVCQNSKELSIHCSNDMRDICQFVYEFEKKVDVDSREIGFELKKTVLEHSPYCKVYNEEVSFERNHALIVSSKDLTCNIILSRYKLYGPQNPKKILDVVSQALGYEEVFINKGLRSIELKRRLKKKFDNLVAEIRREHNLTPTKKKCYKVSKKQKHRYTLFKQKSQSFENENYQENDIQPMSQAEDEFDQQSQFKPFKSGEKRRRILNLQQDRSVHSKQTIKEQANSTEHLQSSNKSVSTCAIMIQKRKIIKRQW